MVIRESSHIWRLFCTALTLETHSTQLHTVWCRQMCSFHHDSLLLEKWSRTRMSALINPFTWEHFWPFGIKIATALWYKTHFSIIEISIVCRLCLFQLQWAPLVLFPQQRQNTEQLDLQPWSRYTVVIKVQRQFSSNHLPQDGYKAAGQLLVIVWVLLIAR